MKLFSSDALFTCGPAPCAYVRRSCSGVAVALLLPVSQSRVISVRSDCRTLPCLVTLHLPTAMTPRYLLALLATFCGGFLPAQLADTLAFLPEGRYPGGVAYRVADSTLFVSSLGDGTVGTVDLQGNYAVFSDDAGLISSAGVALDTVRDRLLVVAYDDSSSVRSNPETAGRLARLLVLDANSGTTLYTHDLHELTRGLRSYGNDVALDTAGNAYVTDSYRPLIYRVTPGGEASVFLRDPAFEPISQESGALALDGLVYHPDGFLIASNYERGRLYRIPLADPTDFAEIPLADTLPGLDDLLLFNDNQLAITRTYADSTDTSVSEVAVITSYDGWQTARLTQQLRPASLTGPTGLVIVGDMVFVTNAHSREPVEGLSTRRKPGTSIFTIIDMPEGSGSR